MHLEAVYIARPLPMFRRKKNATKLSGESSKLLTPRPPPLPEAPHRALVVHVMEQCLWCPLEESSCCGDRYIRIRKQVLGFFAFLKHSQTRHTSLTATAVNRLWRATRVPQNYRPGFIVAQGPQASTHSVLAARDAVAAPHSGRKVAML